MTTTSDLQTLNRRFRADLRTLAGHLRTAHQELLDEAALMQADEHQDLHRVEALRERNKSLYQKLLERFEQQQLSLQTTMNRLEQKASRP